MVKWFSIKHVNMIILKFIMCQLQLTKLRATVGYHIMGCIIGYEFKCAHDINKPLVSMVLTLVKPCYLYTATRVDDKLSATSFRINLIVTSGNIQQNITNI